MNIRAMGDRRRLCLYAVDHVCAPGVCNLCRPADYCVQFLVRKITEYWHQLQRLEEVGAYVSPQ
jgi:hypothetical protein